MEYLYERFDIGSCRLEGLLKETGACYRDKLNRGQVLSATAVLDRESSSVLGLSLVLGGTEVCGAEWVFIPMYDLVSSIPLLDYVDIITKLVSEACKIAKEKGYTKLFYYAWSRDVKVYPEFNIISLLLRDNGFSLILEKVNKRDTRCNCKDKYCCINPCKTEYCICHNDLYVKFMC